MGKAIDQYFKQCRTNMGKTKAQLLGAVRNCGIGDLDCADLRPSDIVSFATVDLPEKGGEHLRRNQKVLKGKREQTEAGVSA